MSLPIKIKLAEDFLKPETRCGYLVSEKQKKIWAVELDLLNALLDVCNKYKIKVVVFAGTLLGTIRHNGFIPWDDDIDVALDRENFEKLCSVAEEEFSNPYFFQTALTDRKCFISEARLRNSLTTASVRGQGSIDYNNGIYIDIHVIDGVVPAGVRRSCQNLLKKVLRKFLIMYYQDGTCRKGIKEYLLMLICPIVRCVPYESIYCLYQKILAMYTASSDYLGLVTHGDWFMDRYYVKKGDLHDVVNHKFECISVPIPRAYAEILSRTYGDYMSFPPPELRGAWHEGQIMFDPDVSYLEVLRKM